MATITKFEDIEAWQLVREICKELYQLSYKDSFSKDYELKSQMRRSSGSMMDNVAEGFERDGKREFIQFLSIGKGSAGELRSQLYRALDVNHITKEEFEKLCLKVEKYSKMVNGLIKYLNTSEIKGKKFQTSSQQPKTKNL